MGNEWRELAIGDVCVRVTSGGTPSRSRPDYFVGGAWPWVKTQELHDGWISDTDEHITAEAIANSSAKVLPVGTVLVAMYGATVGQLGMLAREMTCNQACCALIVDETRADPRFIYYQLLAVRPRLVGLANGAAQQNLSGEIIRQFRLRFPPLREQRRIADVLSALDAKIELNRRMSQTLESMARALFKSWFVDFDPVRARAEGCHSGLPSRLVDVFPGAFDESGFGEIPREWRVAGLDEIADFLNGLALQRFPAGEGPVLPVIKISQLHAGNTVGADRATADIPSEYVVQDGDVLFSWSGSLTVEVWSAGPGALNQHLFKVTSTRWPKWFYYLWTCQHLGGFADIAAGKATTMGHIQRHHLSEAKVVLPSPRVMEAADAVFGPITEASWRIRVQSRNLAAIRDSLLPALLGGEVRARLGGSVATESDA